MRSKFIVSIVSMAMMPFMASANAEGTLPDVQPPFRAEEGRRVQPELKIMSFGGVEQPALWVGNKRIGFREKGNLNSDQVAEIMIDGHEILSFHFWGSAPPKENFGFPFKTKDGTTPKISYDKAANSITYFKEYLQANGETATFSYTLKPAGESKVEVSWDVGIPQDKFEANPKDYAGVSPWFMSSDAYRKEQVRINGKIVQFNDKSVLVKGKETPVANGADGFELVYASDKPLRSFSIKFPTYYDYGVSEGTTGGDSSNVCIRVGAKKILASDKFIVDFGDVVGKADDAPPPVAGIDFWGHDRFCVPAPTTKNLMPNPSFEQGLRFWTWWGGGGGYNPFDVPAYAVSSDSKFGKSALWIRPGKGAQPMNSFIVPVVKGKAYTVSFDAKAEKPNTSFSLGVQGVKGSAFNWETAFKTTHKLSTTDWERKSFTFTADCAGISLLLLSSGQNLLVDGLQIEEGETATDFVAPEVEGFLATSDPDNNLALGQPVNASFSLSGKPDAKGEVRLQLFNYYREKLYDLTLKYSLDATGTAKLELPFNGERLGTGVFVMQADFQPKGGPAIRDYYRLSIMDFLENKHADKDVFGTLCYAT